MTTATNPGNYVDFDEYVGLKLEKTRSTIRTTDLLTALAGVAAMFLGYLLIFVVLDQWVVRDGFGVVWRWILLSTLVATTISWMVWKVGLPSLRTVNGLFAAREIERSEPELKSNLLNLIDLKSTGRTVNPAILKALERQAAVRLQDVDVAHAIDHRPLLRTAYVLLAVIVVFCFYALLSPKKISNSIWRGLLPAAQVPIATITEIIDVKPGDITIQAHQPFVDVQVDLAGEIPPQVWMLYSTTDGKQDQPIELRADEQGVTRFKGQLIGDSGQGLMQDLTYFIKAGDSKSRQYKITVEQPPYAEIESVRIEYPSYMKLQPVEQTGNAAIDAWEGAKVLVSAKTNMPVRSALLQFVDDPQVGPNGEELPMSVSGGRHLQVPWTLALRTDGTYSKNYRIHCRTEDGRVTTGHVLNPLTIRPDQPPEVILLQPDRDLEAPANATIPLLIQARDPDFELGYVYLHVEKSGQKIQREQLFDGRQQKVTLKTEIALKKLDAVAGDLFEFWVEAYDNKQPRPNSKNTPKVKIRIVAPVSPKEADRQLAEQKERVEQKLAEADQETNPDLANNPPPMDGDAKDRQPPNDARARDDDPNQPKPPQDGQPQDNQNGQGQKAQDTANGNKNQPGKQQPQPGATNDKQKSGTGNEQSDPSQGQEGDNSKTRKPLDSEGSQDDEVLQILKKKFGDDSPQKPPGDRPPADKPEQPDPANERTPSENADKQKSADNSSATKKPAESDLNKQQPRNKSESADKKDPAEKKPSDGDGSETPKTRDKKPQSDPASPENGDKKNQKADEKRDATEKNNTEGKNNTDDKNNSKNKKSQDQEMTGDKAAEDTNKSNKPTAKPESTEKPDDGDANSTKSDEKSEKKSPVDKPEKQPGEGKNTAKPGEQNDSEKPTAKPGDPKSDPNSPPEPTDESSKDPKPKSDESTKDEKNPGMKPDAKFTDKDQSQTPSNDGDKSDSQDSQTSKNEPNKNSPSGLNQQSPKEGESGKTNPNKSKDGPSDPASKSNGPKEQTDDSSEAKKQPGDGTEKGVGKPERNPSAKANATKNENVKRDPKVEPETRPGQNAADSPAEKTQKKTNQPNNSPAEEQPPNETDKSKDKMEGKGGGSNPKQDGDSSNTKRDSGSDSTEPGNDKPADKANGNSDPKKSKGPGSKKADGSKGGDKPDSDSPDKSNTGDQAGDKPSPTGEKPSDRDKSADSPDGKKGEDRSPAGKKPDGGPAKDGKANDGQPKDGEAKDGQAGEKSDGKSDSDNPGKKGSDKDGKGDSGKGKSDSGQGKPDGQGEPNGDGKPGKGGKKGGKPSGKPGDPTNDGVPGGGNGGDGAEPGRGGDMPEAERSDDANMEYNRQAAELILQKLNKELERGEVDPDVLKQLGWTESEMKQFADRLSKSLNESKRADENPEAKARQQQFQEMLKNMDLKKSGSQRSGSNDPKRDVNQVESKRTPPPPAYRSVFEKYSRELNRQRPATGEKAPKKD